MELIFGTALINAWIIYNLKAVTKLSKLQFTEHIVEKFTKTASSQQIQEPSEVIQHAFIKTAKKRNCASCYDKLRETMSSKEANNKVKKVKSGCDKCKKTLCRDCYNKNHKYV